MIIHTPPTIVHTGRLARLLAEYYRGPDHPAKLRVWRWLYQCLGRPPVTIRYADAAELRLEYHEYVQSHILKFGFYEPEVWDALAAYAVENEVVWDIGGHVGTTAIRAALDRRVKEVHTFEPNPTSINKLALNLKLNPGLAVELHPFALGDRDESRHLWAGDPGNIGMASLVTQATGNGTAVICTTIDKLIAERMAAPTIIKIDVEGFETQVLDGAKDLLANDFVKAIAFEAEATHDGQIAVPQLAERLTRYGYEIRRIIRPGGTREFEENFLASRQFPPELDGKLSPPTDGVDVP